MLAVVVFWDIKPESKIPFVKGEIFTVGSEELTRVVSLYPGPSLRFESAEIILFAWVVFATSAERQKARPATE